MSRPTNAEEARIYLDELANFTGFGDYAEPFIEAAKAYAILALADAANNVADAIREQKTEHTIHVTQDLDAEAVARNLRAHLDGEAE